MVIQEVYVGRIPEIEAMFQEFKKMRNEYKVYKTVKNAKNIDRLEKMIEDLWGFKAFSLKIDPSAYPNAYTYPVAMSIDINPGDYIISTSKGYRYKKECNAASISYITKGLLEGKNFSDEEVFAIFLHEIGHSFTHRSPMIIAQHEIYKNTLIMQIVYQLFLSIVSLNPVLAAQSINAYLMSNNGYKQLLTEFNKKAKKVPLLRELNITWESAKGSLKSVIGNFSYLVTSITGLNYLANRINKKSYDTINKKRFKISGHPRAYARSAERLSDDFATMYGFGPYLSTGLIKMESPDNQGLFMKVSHNIPILGTFLKKQDAMSTELNGLLGAHPSSPDRILAILNNMENDLAKDESLSPKIKRELKANIEKQKDIIKDLKKDQPEIYKNKNEYIMLLTKAGLEGGNTEDFMEKKYTNQDQLQKFYNSRRIRKECANLGEEFVFTDSDMDLISDEYVIESINDIFDDKSKKNVNKMTVSDKEMKAGKQMLGTVFRLSLKQLIQTAGKSDQEKKEYFRTVRMPALVKSCKTMDQIKYLRKDLYLAKQQYATLKRNIDIVNTNDQTKMKRLHKSFIKQVQSGKINKKDIDDQLNWLNTTYKKMIDDRAKEIKATINESIDVDLILSLYPEIGSFLE